MTFANKRQEAEERRQLLFVRGTRSKFNSSVGWRVEGEGGGWVWIEAVGYRWRRFKRQFPAFFTSIVLVIENEVKSDIWWPVGFNICTSATSAIFTVRLLWIFAKISTEFSINNFFLRFFGFFIGTEGSRKTFDFCTETDRNEVVFEVVFSKIWNISRRFDPFRHSWQRRWPFRDRYVHQAPKYLLKNPKKSQKDPSKNLEPNDFHWRSRSTSGAFHWSFQSKFLSNSPTDK